MAIDQLKAEVARIPSNPNSVLHRKALIVVDPNADVKFCSDFSRDRLAAQDWPLHIRNKKLVANDPTQTSSLNQQIADVAMGTKNLGVMHLDRSPSKLPLIIFFSKFELDEYVLLSIRDPSWEDDADLEKLKQIFSLTQREAELCGHIARGYTVKEFATTRCLAVDTVKSHLKGVFAKIKVQSQGQLVAVVVSILR